MCQKGAQKGNKSFPNFSVQFEIVTSFPAKEAAYSSVAGTRQYLHLETSL